MCREKKRTQDCSEERLRFRQSGPNRKVSQVKRSNLKYRRCNLRNTGQRSRNKKFTSEFNLNRLVKAHNEEEIERGEFNAK